jgi:hypothetical protein
MVESFELSTESAGSAFNDTDFKTRLVSVNKQQLTYLGGITLGMSYSQVKQFLEKKAIKPTVAKNMLTWREKGCDQVRTRTPNHDELTYTIWTGKLTFHHKRLTDIRIECE